jgi:hypothetical protein
VRHELLPLLTELAPGIVNSLTALADELARPAPEPLPLTDVEGAALRLGRAQRRELARMLEAPTPSARLRLPGGLELRVDPATRRIRVEG